MIDLEHIDIFITAGGENSSMSQDWAILGLEEKPMISYLTDMLESNQLAYKIIANAPAYALSGFESMTDVIPDKGPMGALLTSFYYSEKDYVLLLGSDTPFLPVEVIHRLVYELEEEKITASLLGLSLFPLQAIYPVSLMDQVLSFITDDMLKMKELILRTEHKLVGMDDIIRSHPIGFFNYTQPINNAPWKQESLKN